jgi:hypothetical protein
VPNQVVVPFAQMQEAFARDPARYHEAIDRGATEAAGGDPVLKAQYLAAWNNAMSLLRMEDTGSTVMATAQDDVAARIQTALVDSALNQNRMNVVRNIRRPRSGAAESESAELFEVKFDNDDWWGWLSMAWKLIFRPKKHEWAAPPESAESIDDNAVIAIFSDWGTGLYGAPHIANSVSRLERCDICLHLGDTYYSGSEREIQDRLVADWPHLSLKAVSRTLNGNHEMYSGGQGYFQALKTPPFHQPASCFAMQNTNWLLICLDTAYVDFDLDDSQVEWVQRRIAAAGNRKIILFSHHQPYSVLSGGGENLQSKLGLTLDNGRIYAWFFGHEHRLILYAPHTKWGVSARCVGHGGFPEFRATAPGCGGPTVQFVPLAATIDVPASELLDGPNPFVDDDPSDPAKYNPHGYLTLQFAGAAVRETYFDPAGGIYRGPTAL